MQWKYVESVVWMIVIYMENTFRQVFHFTRHWCGVYKEKEICMTCTDLCFFLQQRYCKSLLLIVIQTQEKRDIWAVPVSHLTLVFKET
jgi:hypothetical protein